MNGSLLTWKELLVVFVVWSVVVASAYPALKAKTQLEHRGCIPAERLEGVQLLRCKDGSVSLQSSTKESL